MGKLTRVFDFDAAHRVMHEKFKCFNLHGHRFRVEVTLSYSEKDPIGYAIDFKEIKRVLGTWIDASFDHATILNPKDVEVIALCARNRWRMYLMGLGREADINPSAENIASEIFYCIGYIVKYLYKGKVTVENIRIYETPNCWVDANNYDYEATDDFKKFLEGFAENFGVENYDVREDAKEKR